MSREMMKELAASSLQSVQVTSNAYTFFVSTELTSTWSAWANLSRKWGRFSMLYIVVISRYINISSSVMKTRLSPSFRVSYLRRARRYFTLTRLKEMYKFSKTYCREIWIRSLWIGRVIPACTWPSAGSTSISHKSWSLGVQAET